MSVGFMKRLKHVSFVLSIQPLMDSTKEPLCSTYAVGRYALCHENACAGEIKPSLYYAAG